MQSRATIAACSYSLSVNRDKMPEQFIGFCLRLNDIAAEFVKNLIVIGERLLRSYVELTIRCDRNVNDELVHVG